MKVTAMLVAACFIAAAPAAAQQAEVTASQTQTEEEFNRFSIGLQGGVATGYMNISSKGTGVIGVNGRYSFNPKISIQGNVLFGEFISDHMNCDLFDPHFNNNYWHFSAQGHFNMLQILSRENAPYGLNIYTLAGLGFIQSDVSAGIENPTQGWEDFEPQDNNDLAFYYQVGLGVRVKLSDRVDIFTQYDYNITGNDRLDGFESQDLESTDLHNGRNDYFMNFTAGLQFKLGPSGRKDADWDWPSPPPPPVAAEPADYDDRLSDLEDELDEKQNEIDALYDRLSDMNDVAQVERVDDGMMVTLDTEVMFDFDRSELKPEALQTLSRFLGHLEGEEVSLTVIGHTCNIGTEEYNQGLSERRSASVTRYLISQGFDNESIRSYGLGETEPKYDNSTPEGASMNRRVEIMIE